MYVNQSKVECYVRKISEHIELDRCLYLLSMGRIRRQLSNDTNCGYFDLRSRLASLIVNKIGRFQSMVYGRLFTHTNTNTNTYIATNQCVHLT